MAVSNDPAVLDLDPGAQLVDKSDGAGARQCLDVGQLVARGIVIVHRTQVERQSHHSWDRFRGDPGNRGCRPFVPHGNPLLATVFVCTVRLEAAETVVYGGNTSR